MKLNQYLEVKRKNELKRIGLILREAKKDNLLKEGRGGEQRQKAYLTEADKSVAKYYAYALIQREFRILAEVASLVAQEDTSVAFLLKNLGADQSSNEIGAYIQDNFADLIQAVETLQKNAGEQEKGPVSKTARSGGYGGGMSMGTAGIVREIFGSPPQSGRRDIPRYSSAGKSSATPPPPPAAAKKASPTLANYMSGHEKGMEKQQNLAMDNEKAMQTLETKLPKAAEFLQAVVGFFSDEENIQKLAQPTKKGFFGGNTKEKLLKSAFSSFPNFNVGLFARELEDRNVVSSLAKTANQMYSDVHTLTPLTNLVKGKLSKSIGDRLKGMFGKSSPGMSRIA